MTDLAGADYLELLRTERDRMAAVEADELARPVPHLEGWTVHSVVGHMAWLCRFVTLALAATPDDPPNRGSVGEPPIGGAVLDWFTEGADEVIAALQAAEPGTIRPTWTGPQPASWWLRRLAHELSIHRWDAEVGAGREAHPVDATQAIDGIDEVLEVFVPNRLEFGVLDAAGRTIHLHTTDVEGGEWMLHLHADRIEWERAHAKGDVAARATASDLMLLLWGRIGPDQVDVFGDEDLLRRWQAAAAF